MKKNMYEKYKDALYLEMTIVQYLEFLEKELDRLLHTVPAEYSLDYHQSLCDAKEYFEFVLKEIYKKGREKKRPN